MRVAVVGCGHGELDRIYQVLNYIERTQLEHGQIDLLLICGDVQTLRDENDLKSMSVPGKYKSLGSFLEYYQGSKKAAVPTVLIGGNHEASSYLSELFYGGFVAENMFYLGAAGVIRFGGLRIAGVSGIFKSHDYRKRLLNEFLVSC
jgi:lariat debranching enzyme